MNTADSDTIVSDAELDAAGVRNWLVKIPGAPHEPYAALLSKQYIGLLFGTLKAELRLEQVPCPGSGAGGAGR